jgi:hypothetical protein
VATCAGLGAALGDQFSAKEDMGRKRNNHVSRNAVNPKAPEGEGRP